MPSHGGRPDPLQIQLSIRVPRKGKYTADQLEQIVQAWADGEKLPRGVVIRGVFWRNPERKPPLDEWRRHQGAPRRAQIAGVDVERGNRGTLEDARDTLAGFLRRIIFEQITIETPTPRRKAIRRPARKVRKPRKHKR